MFRLSLAVIAVVLLSTFRTVSAQDLFVYPTQNQSAKQQEQDKFECYGWAKQQSGYDPTNPPAANASSAPDGRSTTESTARGAVIGGLSGAVIGEIVSDDAGKGALVGAVGGGVFSGMRRQRNRQASQQQQSNQIQSMRAAYTRAYAVCLEGRGYNVR